MRVRLHSTSQLSVLVLDGDSMPARIWEGTTESGIPVICWITRIAVARDQDLSEFQAELIEERPPSAEAQAFPRRMVL